jgi:hypothetical protein
LAIALLVVLAVGAGHAAPFPWQRTETREPCRTSDPFRAPYFGDLHIHTRFSADAYIFGTRVGPRDAYAFATGSAIPFADDDEGQTRSARIDRPLDFAAVTDHGEFFGEVRLCDTSGSPVYDSFQCDLLRRAEAPDQQRQASVAWLFPAGIPEPAHHRFCTEPGIDCGAAAVSVWGEMQAAAEEVYDRTAGCTFTSFLGYEYTASPVGRHLHRNVIFRNHQVPASVASYIEAAGGGIPQGLWSAVESGCLDAGTGCDAVVIPHNPNLSGGMQFTDPADADEALRRQTLEPLVEIHQIKGNSECRFDRLVRAGAGTADELCTFEQAIEAHQGPDEDPPPIAAYPPRNLVRNALKDGLAFEETLGVNPFRFGFVGSTDNHDGAAGSVAESGWAGFQGNNDSSPARQIADQMRANPGGLAVAWAEENSRDAIFAALRRRETYATSGTRPVVRFFGGELDGVTCGSATFVRDAYATGTPMGGELGPVRGKESPRFAVWAVQDPGTNETPGTGLARVQIVKGWVDARGATQERVVDVAGDTAADADVDPATCAPRAAGAHELCVVWEDPDFDRRVPAFYYARVLEKPTCRWSTRVCRAAGVDPMSADCAAQATAAGPAFANCCRGPADDPFLDPVVQERAWTSPIWYRPVAVARVRARVRYGAEPGTDRLDLRLGLGRVPKRFRPQRTGLEVRVGDDDDILTLTIPPRGLVAAGPGRWVLRKRIAPIRKLTLVLGRRPELRLATAPTDLVHADASEHMVTVSLAAGTYRVSHSRLWTMRDGALELEEP